MPNLHAPHSLKRTLLKIATVIFLLTPDGVRADDCIDYTPEEGSFPIQFETTGTEEVHLTGEHPQDYSVPYNVKEAVGAPMYFVNGALGSTAAALFRKCDGVFGSGAGSFPSKTNEFDIINTVSATNGSIEITEKGISFGILPGCAPAGGFCSSDIATFEKKHRYDIATGAYSYTATTTRDFVGVDKDGNTLSVHQYDFGTTSGKVKVPNACSVTDLTPLSDYVKNHFEPFSSKGTAPSDSLYPPSVDAVLSSRVDAFQSFLASQYHFTSVRESGYRPLEYQRHIYEVNTKRKELENAPDKNSPACSWLANKLKTEFENHHLGNGVSNPDSSLHTVFPAQAVDLTGIKGNGHEDQIERAANDLGLIRPCRSERSFDRVHFTLQGTVCNSQKNFTVRWPEFTQASFHMRTAITLGDILVTDPLGRRVGYDPSVGPLNEIGGSTWISARGLPVQYIEIGATVPGTYSVKVFGAENTPYELTMSRVSEEGGALDTTIRTGKISSDGATFASMLPKSLKIDIQPSQRKNKVIVGSRSVTVAILSELNFDPLKTVIRKSLRFGIAGKEKSLLSCLSKGRDFNKDHIKDLICLFSTPKSRLSLKSSEGRLTGQLRSGESFESNDIVVVESKSHKPVRRRTFTNSFAGLISRRFR